MGEEALTDLLAEALFIHINNIELTWSLIVRYVECFVIVSTGDLVKNNGDKPNEICLSVFVVGVTAL